MSSSARHKLTGLGLHKAVAAVATAAGSAGEGGKNAIELQWEILRWGHARHAAQDLSWLLALAYAHMPGRLIVSCDEVYISLSTLHQLMWLHTLAEHKRHYRFIRVLSQMLVVSSCLRLRLHACNTGFQCSNLRLDDLSEDCGRQHSISNLKVEHINRYTTHSVSESCTLVPSQHFSG